MNEPIRVLAVDDDKDLCAVTKDMLEAYGPFRVDTAGSVRQAMEALAKQRYDAIVSDYQMPLEDGIAFLKELRARGDRIPFVLFTGRGREDIVIEAINSGADAYVQKGTDTRSVFTELVHRIRHAVDKVRAENALMESETRYRSLIDGSSVGILLTDVNLEYVYSNRRWLEMTSRTEEESKGRGWMAWIAPEDRTAFEEGWRLSAESGGERSFEYRYAGKDGDTVWIWGNASPLRDADGSVTSYISTNVDITERRRIEEALLEKERTIARASNLTKMGYWIWKAETGVITPSDGLSALLGIPAGTMLPHDTFFDMVHPEDRKAVIAAFGDALNGKPDIKTEHRMVRSDSSVITVRDTVEITTIKGNRPVYIMGMVQDITELTRVSETLRETENLYHMVFDTIAEGVVVVDRESNIIVSNGEAARLLGYPLGGKAPTMNQVDERLVREDGTDCPLDESPSRITVATGRPLNDEIRGLRQPSGEVRWLSVNTRPLYPEGGTSPYSVVVSLVDITEKKLAKDGLAEANRKLALLSNITRHDILNQLQVLTGSLEIIGAKGTEREDIRSRMRQTAKNIDALIRFTAEYEELGSRSPAYINVRKTVGEIVRNVTLSGLRVVNKLDDVEVLADPLLSKVFYNLIENTARHGGKATFVRFRSEAADGEFRMICEDDGEGIPPDEKSGVFDKGKGRNFGLGLFFSREILSITGMTIHEAGSQGEGAQFIITVPKGKWRQKG